MTSNVDVVTFGETMGLVLAAGGTIELAATALLGCAGAEATVAVGLARLGHLVAYFGRVGDDPFGDRIVRALRADGVDTTELRRDDRPTGVLTRDAGVERPVTVSYHRTGSAGSALSPEDVPRDLIAAARVLHVTGITAAVSESARAATLLACDVARVAGVTVVVDPNVRLRLADAAQWRVIADELASVADIVLVGHEDAAVICGDDEPVVWFTARGATTVVVKSGSAGAVETTDGRAVSAAGRAVRAVDPVGAGDAFAAGWISGWLRGLDPLARLTEANIVAACSVAALGDLDGLPSARVRDRIAHDAGSDVLR